MSGRPSRLVLWKSSKLEAQLMLRKGEQGDVALTPDEVSRLRVLAAGGPLCIAALRAGFTITPHPVRYCWHVYHCKSDNEPVVFLALLWANQKSGNAEFFLGWDRENGRKRMRVLFRGRVDSVFEDGGPALRAHDAARRLAGVL